MRASTDYDWSSRIERAFTQRIYLMDSGQLEDGSFRFKMMGNSGKAYDIVAHLGEDISCSCPDHQVHHNFCKHIMHLLIRVIGIPRQTVFEHYYRNRNFAVGSETIHPCIAWFDRKKNNLDDVLPGEPAVEEEIPGQVKRREIEEDDDCPVCYEAFADTAQEQTIWCRVGCGKSVHQSCFLKWSQSISRKYGGNKVVTCVYCRTEWVWG